MRSKRSGTEEWKEIIVNILGGTCQYCGSTKNIEIDHILPVAKGGANEIANLQLLCYSCHKDKHRFRNRATPQARDRVPFPPLGTYSSRIPPKIETDADVQATLATLKALITDLQTIRKRYPE